MSGVSLDIGSLTGGVLGYKSADKDRQAQQYWNQQNQLSSTNQFNESLSWQKEQYYDKTKMRRLVEMAKGAGISPLAALGMGGSAPTSASLSPTRPGRVAGNLSSQAFKGMAVLQFRQQKARTTIEEAKADAASNIVQSIKYPTGNTVSVGKIKPDQVMVPGHSLEPEVPPPLYEFYSDNTPQAVRMRLNGYVPMPSGANMELPESIGAGYWISPRVGNKPADTSPGFQAYDYLKGL